MLKPAAHICACCIADMCSTSTLFVLLSDLFDTISLDECEQVFSFVEERVTLWKLVGVSILVAQCYADYMLLNFTLNYQLVVGILWAINCLFVSFLITSKTACELFVHPD